VRIAFNSQEPKVSKQEPSAKAESQMAGNQKKVGAGCDCQGKNNTPTAARSSISISPIQNPTLLLSKKEDTNAQSPTTCGKAKKGRI
jgi:hypothetical protein